MSDVQPKPPAIPAVPKYDKVFAQRESDRTKHRQAVMAKWYEPYGRFIYGYEAAAARANEGTYTLPDWWNQ